MKINEPPVACRTAKKIVNRILLLVKSLIRFGFQTLFQSSHFSDTSFNTQLLKWKVRNCVWTKQQHVSKNKGRFMNWQKIMGSQYYKTLISFAIKLAHFKVQTIFFSCYKHWSLTTKNGKNIRFSKKKVW